MFDKAFKKVHWPDGKPNKYLWKKFKGHFPVQNLLKDNAQFRQVDLSLIKDLANQDLFNLTQKEYQTLLYRNGAIQKVQACTKDAQSLINKMQEIEYKYELMQIIFITNGGKIKSPVIKGSQNEVSNLKEIKNIILSTRFELERHDLQIKSIHLLHTHPSLELIVTTSQKTFLNIHPLTRSDVGFLRELQYHFQWPISLSAVTPSGIQYTTTCENILDS